VAGQLGFGWSLSSIFHGYYGDFEKGQRIDQVEIVLLSARSQVLGKNMGIEL